MIPGYLDFKKPLMHLNDTTNASQATAWNKRCHLIFEMVCSPKPVENRDSNTFNRRKSSRTSWTLVEQQAKFFTLIEPFRNAKDSHGKTMLMYLVANNTNPSIRNFLLGARFDKDEEKFVFIKASKPRTNIDA